MMTWAPCPHGVRTRGKKFYDQVQGDSLSCLMTWSLLALLRRTTWTTEQGTLPELLSELRQAGTMQPTRVSPQSVYSSCLPHFLCHGIKLPVSGA